MPRPLLVLTVVAGLLCAPGQSPAAVTGETILVDGPSFAASLDGVTDGWTLQFSESGKIRPVFAAELVRWGNFAEATRGPQLLLGGGGLIIAEPVAIAGDRLQAESRLFGRLELPLEALSGIVVNSPTDRAARDQLIGRIQSAGGQSDRVLLDNGDELSGTISDLNGEVLRLQSEPGPLELRLTSVRALIFNPALAGKVGLSGERALVGFRDGSRLLASRLVTSQRQARLKIPGSVDISAPIDSACALLPLGGKPVYLSDLNAVSYKHVPYLSTAWPYERDRSVSGALLRSAGQLHLKGLGMHSASRITYALDKPYRRLQAEVAVDDETQNRGSVVFRVFVDDGSGQWQPKFSSPIVRGGDKPLPISVDLSGAKRISLLVDFADRGSEMDHADWLNVRLVQ